MFVGDIEKWRIWHNDRKGEGNRRVPKQRRWMIKDKREDRVKKERARLD